jgi:hypothetical protein
MKDEHIMLTPNVHSVEFLHDKGAPSFICLRLPSYDSCLGTADNSYRCTKTVEFVGKDKNTDCWCNECMEWWVNNYKKQGGFKAVVFPIRDFEVI